MEIYSDATNYLVSCNVIFRLQTFSLNMSILKYFKLRNLLPSLEGPLLRELPSSSIQAAIETGVLVPFLIQKQQWKLK